MRQLHDHINRSANHLLSVVHIYALEPAIQDLLQIIDILVPVSRPQCIRGTRPGVGDALVVVQATPCQEPSVVLAHGLDEIAARAANRIVKEGGAGVDVNLKAVAVDGLLVLAFRLTPFLGC